MRQPFHPERRTMAATHQKTEQKLGKRIGVIIMICLAITMTAMIGMSVVLERNLVTSSFAKQTKIAMELLATNIGGAVKFKKADKVEEGVSAFLEQLSEEVRWLAAVDGSGQIIYEVGQNAKKAEIISQFVGEQERRQTLVIDGTTKAQPVFFGPKNALVGGLIIEWSHEQINAATLKNALIVSLGGLVVASIGAVLSIWQLNAMVVRPVRDIDTATQTLAKGQYEVEIPAQDRRDEVGRLGRNVERLRESLFAASQVQADKEKAEAMAAEEKRKTLDALETGIGSVVQAAKLGAFDRRVDLSGDDDTIRGIGKSVNELCDNVSAFLADLAGSLDALAAGDISHRFGGGHEGQFSNMADQFNDAMGRFGDLVSRVQSTSSEMVSSIDYVSSGSQTLSEQTAQQAAALEEANAAMEVVNNSVTANSNRSREIASQTAEARTRATDGQSVVRDAVNAMDAIQQSAEKITAIISVIDDIAFQTNLLALNAAVEAARAGDAGKGFAVVASEVRTLAQKASDSASDIKELINISTEKVRSGAELVNETGVALERIMESIETVGGQIQDISSATQEQANGVSEITETVRALEQNTTRNAQFSDGTAAAAQKLERQAAALNEISAMFASGGRKPFEPEIEVAA